VVAIGLTSTDLGTADGCCVACFGGGATGVTMTHCKENTTYEFLFWELCGLSPNFHIQVSPSDLYILRISPHISLQQNRQSYPGNK
jgi:hypothetical protein